MQPCNLVLIAAGLDWLEGLLPVAFVLIWIVSQVMNLFRNAAGKGGGQAAGKPAKPVRAAPRVPRPAGERPVAVDAEIEEFLRRTLQGDPPQPARPANRPPRPRPPKPAAAGTGRQPAVSSPSIPPPVPGSRKSLRQTKAGIAPAGRSGDGDVARHVAAAFAHDLIHEVPLAAAETGPPQAPSVADELLVALRSSAGMRQLILMREVLDRPTHRW